MKKTLVACYSILLMPAGLAPASAAIEEVPAINRLSKCGTGITSTGEVKTFDSNIISGGLDARGIPSNLHGIDLYNGFTYKIPLQITRNRITDYPYGIRLMNVWVNNSFVVADNQVSFNFSEDQLGGQVYRGVFMSNCLGAKVASNIILWNSGLIIPADINAHAYDVQGLRMEHVQSSDIKDNTVTTCGTGMFLYDDCSGTYFTCNHFQDNYPGIDFSVSVLPPAQGSAYSATFNTWGGNYDNSSGLFKVTGLPSPFYYYYNSASSSEFPDPPLLMTGILVPVQITSVSQNPCTNGGSHNGNMMADDTTKKNIELANILDQQDSTPADDFPAQTEYKKQEYAYLAMLELPSLANTSDRVDFMNSTGQNNIGKLKEVSDLLLARDTSQAIVKNNLVLDSNLIETNKKAAHNLNLLSDTLTASDSIAGNLIAQQLALQAGEAVYWMRGKFRNDIEDNYISNLRKANPQVKPKPLLKKLIAIYPNPASNQLIVSGLQGICDIELYDCYGKLIRKFISKEKNTTINLADFANGIYYLKISNNTSGYFKTIFSVLK